MKAALAKQTRPATGSESGPGRSTTTQTDAAGQQAAELRSLATGATVQLQAERAAGPAAAQADELRSLLGDSDAAVQASAEPGAEQGAGSTSETKGENGLLTRESYQQKLDHTFGTTLELDDWSPKELDLLYRASFSLSKKDSTSREVMGLKSSSAWEKSVSLFGEVLAGSTVDQGNLDFNKLNLKLGMSFLLKREVTLERSLSDGRTITEKRNPLDLSFDVSVSRGFDLGGHQKPENRVDVGFTLRF